MLKIREMTSLLMIVSMVVLSGCEGPARETYAYRTEYQSPKVHKSAQLYDPTGDPAYSYDPVYDPVDRAPTYIPGTPAYKYNYYYYKGN